MRRETETVPTMRAGVACARLRGLVSCLVSHVSCRVSEGAAVAAYLVALAVVLARMAAVKAYWFDELFTLHLSRFGSVRELLANLAAGADLNPPLNYLLTHLAVSLFGESPIAVRSPAIFGALLAHGSLYAFLRHRRPAAEAWLGMLALGLTPAAWYYFVEARPYGLMLGLAGFALLAWQRRWAVPFALALMLGVLSHYYFVLPLAALAAAEVVRKPSRGMLVGFALAALVLLACLPLMAAGAEYKPGFWAKTKLSLTTIADAYQKLTTGEVVPPVLFAVFVAFLPGKRVEGRIVPTAEVVALILLALGPAFGVVIGAKLTGAYFHRYSLPATLGLAGLFALALGRIGPRWLWLAVPVVAYFGPLGHWRTGPGYFANDARELAALADFLGANATGRVACDSAFDAVRLHHHHGGRNFQPVFRANPAAAMRHTHTDTLDRGLLALARVAGGPVCGEPPAYFLGPRASWRAAYTGFTLVPAAERPGGKLWKLVKE